MGRAGRAQTVAPRPPGELDANDAAQARALRDPRIATAVQRIHGQPQRPWTVGELAAEVGLSRSAPTAAGQEPQSHDSSATSGQVTARSWDVRRHDGRSALG
jgi:hypothetical protein